MTANTPIDKDAIDKDKRIQELLAANNAAAEARRQLTQALRERDATVSALGAQLAAEQSRRAAAEARAEQQANQAAAMLPARLRAERQREAARDMLRRAATRFDALAAGSEEAAASDHLAWAADCRTAAEARCDAE